VCIRFPRDTSLVEDGLLPVLIGTVTALNEARQLVGLVEATYRPLVFDLIASLEGLRVAGDELSDRQTVGARSRLGRGSHHGARQRGGRAGCAARTRCPAEPSPGPDASAERAAS
jgi:hypothetical protein